jgi:molybdate transport repressor ModE-like protein
MSTFEPQADRPKTTRPARKRDPAPAAWPTLRLTLRLDVGGRPTLGPGKARLLELIGQTGLISAAARAMGMSYRRAWTLVDSLNASFAAPLIAARPGGAGGGGGHPAVAWRRGRPALSGIGAAHRRRGRRGA